MELEANPKAEPGPQIAMKSSEKKVQFQTIQRSSEKKNLVGTVTSVERKEHETVRSIARGTEQTEETKEAEGHDKTMIVFTRE